MAKLSFRKLLIILFILLCLSIIVFALVVAYHTKKDINETKNTWDKIHACYDKWKGSARVPIVGGGFLDGTRIRWNPTFSYVEYNECGAKSYTTGFYWTGESIITEEAWLESVKGKGFGHMEPPKEWIFMNAVYMLGYPKEINKDGTYPSWENLPTNRKPTGKVAKLPKAGLEVWMGGGDIYHVMKDKSRGIHDLAFHFSEWPEDEGPPRFIFCDMNRNVANMHVEEIERLDDVDEKLTCRMERWEFRFRGGSAEVSATVTSLSQLYPALYALYEYFSASVMED